MHDGLRFGPSVGWLLGVLLAGSAFAQAVPDGVARIHYHRPDGVYDGFELHVWEDTHDSVTWADGLDVAGRDDFGVYWDVGLQDGAERVGFIIHRVSDDDINEAKQRMQSDEPRYTTDKVLAHLRTFK